MADGEFDNLIVNVKVGIGTKTPAGKMEVKTEWEIGCFCDKNAILMAMEDSIFTIHGGTQHSYREIPDVID